MPLRISGGLSYSNIPGQSGGNVACVHQISDYGRLKLGTKGLGRLNFVGSFSVVHPLLAQRLPVPLCVSGGLSYSNIPGQSGGNVAFVHQISDYGPLKLGTKGLGR
jgi:hypothetical protein